MRRFTAPRVKTPPLDGAEARIVPPAGPTPLVTKPPMPRLGALGGFTPPRGQPKRVLLKQVGNLGDHLFLVGALLEGLDRAWPDAEISLVTAWGYKNHRGQWGKRNQDGYCISLMKENPHVDHLIHWSDFYRSLDATFCREEGRAFPTWDRAHFDAVAKNYDVVAELEFGLAVEENPLERIAASVGLPQLKLGPYPLYATADDWAVGRAIADRLPRPRVVFLEGMEGASMRGWDPQKAQCLVARFARECGIRPLWWGAQHAPLFHGRTLTLRENIAFLGACDLAIGVMGAPMHFAAAAGIQTICLYGAQPYHRAAPGFFFNATIEDPNRQHVTIFGPTCDEPCFLKRALPCKNLRGADRITAGFQSWRHPGRQSDKSCVAAIPVETVFATVMTSLEQRGLLSQTRR